MFEYITFDLIQHDLIYNKNQWITHAICDFINFNIVFIIQYHTTILEIFIQILHLIKWSDNGLHSHRPKKNIHENLLK